MPTLPRPARVLIFTTAASVFGLLMSWIGWPAHSPGFELAGLMLVAIAVSLPFCQPPPADWLTLRFTFIIEFTALMLLGIHPAMVVAACGAVARELADRDRSEPMSHRLIDVATSLLSLRVAAWAYAALGGTLARFVWPWQALPIAAAVLAYVIVMSASADLLTPLTTRRSLGDGWRSWPRRLLQGWPVHIVGASVATGLVALLAQERWVLLALAAVPLALAARLYAGQAGGSPRDHRRDPLQSLQDGVCAIDRSGKIRIWNDAVERLTGCPRDRAIGTSLLLAVPSLGATDVPRALQDVATNRVARTLSHVALRGGDTVRILQVKLSPAPEGVTVLWQDVTEQTRAMQTLQRKGERLTLAAEVANDGLWEWDLGAQQFHVTGRWKAMIGLSDDVRISKPEEWFDRVHGDDIGPLKEALETHIAGKSDRFQHEHRIRHEDGTFHFFQCRGVAARLGGGRPTHIAGSLTDTTDLAITQERLRNAVYRDPLTGLYNRAVFVEGLGRRLRESQRRRGNDPFALLYLDLDRFKVVNDSLGHLVGDELLVAVSRRLEACLRQGDVLARLGGDEFAILLNGLQTEQQANVIAFRVQEALSKPFLIGGREVFTSASIGIAFGVAQYDSPDEMMHDADTAMYQAKANGKARHEVFDADMDARARDRLGLENDLRRAVHNNDLETHYQPIVSLASGMCIGFESLVRWTRNGKPVPPSTFIPIAEELGLIDALGTRVLEEACSTFAAWQRRYPEAGLDCITVNVSSRQLMQQNFLSVVERAVQKAGLKPGALRVEITETALMTSPDEAAKVLKQLRDFGVKIYLDDFGTGYSSLSHLHKLPVDALKIDRSFVRSLLLPDRPAIVESILALARTLHTNVVAEGIESDVQARELERLGCTHAQGYLFSRPISGQSVEQILISNKPLGPKNVQPAPIAVC